MAELASGSGRRILFTRTKHQARKWAKKLTSDGIPAVDLHGNLSQPQRDRNLSAFADGSVRVLVATDVAARGVHVDGIELVVHVDPPAEHKAYLHRSGRTARAGSSGDVVTSACPSSAATWRSCCARPRSLCVHSLLTPAAPRSTNSSANAPPRETATGAAGYPQLATRSVVSPRAWRWPRRCGADWYRPGRRRQRIARRGGAAVAARVQRAPAAPAAANHAAPARVPAPERARWCFPQWCLARRIVPWWIAPWHRSAQRRSSNRQDMPWHRARPERSFPKTFPDGHGAIGCGRSGCATWPASTAAATDAGPRPPHARSAPPGSSNTGRRRSAVRGRVDPHVRVRGTRIGRIDGQLAVRELVYIPFVGPAQPEVVRRGVAAAGIGLSQPAST